jgi:hypothetical protein
MRTPHHLPATLATLFAFALTLAGHGQAFAVGKPTTRLLAMAACPGWKVIDDDPKTTKLMAESCEKDIATAVPALSKSFGIAKDNVTTKLNAEADYQGVTEALTTLASETKPDDRVVIYLNFHGGSVDAKYAGYGVEDEVLAMYTEKEPKDFTAATADGIWMSMKTLRDLVDQIKAKEVIVIFEVCEASGGMKDFRYDIARRYQNGWKGREAIVFSSRGDQAATFNEAGTIALFTEILSKQLTGMLSGNIRDAVHKAAIETHRSRRATCMKQDNLDTLYDDRAAYLDGCTQMPIVFDPYGLLDDIQSGGTTVMSRWQEIEDQNRKPAGPKKKDEDPFAWTKPFRQQSQDYANPYATPAANAGPFASQ